MVNAVREASLAKAQRLNYPINPNLPDLETPQKLRGVEEIAQRLLALYAVVSASYGFPKAKALDWLDREGLSSAILEEERTFLTSEMNEAQTNAMQWQVEALWVLAWAVGCHETLDFSDSCSDNFISMLPDLKAGAPTAPFLESLSMRTKDQVQDKLDLAYCLHWGAREAALATTVIKGAVPEAVIRERRRALEWLAGEDDWYEVNLDT